MHKQITLSIILAGSIFMAGCGSSSNSSTTQGATSNTQVAKNENKLEVRGETVNQAPVANAQTYCTKEDTNLTKQLTATDDSNGTLTYNITKNPSCGIIKDFNSTSGMFTYVPKTGFTGKDDFNFTATDEDNATSEEKSITVIVIKDNNETDIPNTPENLEANATSTTQVKLTWTDTSDNEDGFLILQDGVPVAIADKNQTTKWICGLEEGKEYKFTIRSANEAGCSDDSNEVTVTTQTATEVPVAPTNLKVVDKSKTDVKLQWDDNANNESGYKVYKDGVLVKTVAENTTCTIISGLTAETEYLFKVVAYNAVGESEDSNEVTVITDSNESGVNHAPIAYDKTYSTYKDTNLTSELCACDTDGDSLTYAITEEPTHGSVDLNTTSGKFTYSPNVDYVGDDSFKFTASDDTNTSEEKTATIKICEKN